MKNKPENNLIGFYESLVEHFKQKEAITSQDIYLLYPETSGSTIRWRLHELTEQGKIFREEKGVYSLIPPAEHTALGYDYLQETSKEIYDILQNYGYNFYLSGLDALSGELLHVPEKYPVILITESQWIKEIQTELLSHDLYVLTNQEVDKLKNTPLQSKVDVYILPGENFLGKTQVFLDRDNIANKEKGFVDLYYAVTRLEYPFSIQELSRTYNNLKRNKTVRNKLLLKAAQEHKIRSEFDWLADLETVPEPTKEFMRIQLS
ncbi:MAG: hypothetical protein AB9907_13345 [Flexilinea sp.]